MAEPLSPAEVEGHPLKRRGRGYARDEVDTHLAQVSRSYRQLWGERAELRAKLTTLFEDERQLGEALLAAQRSADRVIADADEEAHKVVAGAEEEAHKVVAGAEEEARKIVADAQEEARKLVADARDEAKRIADEVRHEHEREAAAVGRLRAVRRESEAHLRELADAILALLDEEHTDLQSALAMRRPGNEVVDEQSPVASSGRP
jgi:cell division septum initiation protein DivIVA